jgi:hypothetical protein
MATGRVVVVRERRKGVAQGDLVVLGASLDGALARAATPRDWGSRPPRGERGGG